MFPCAAVLIICGQYGVWNEWNLHCDKWKNCGTRVGLVAAHLQANIVNSIDIKSDKKNLKWFGAVKDIFICFLYS